MICQAPRHGVASPVSSKKRTRRGDPGEPSPEPPQLPPLPGLSLLPLQPPQAGRLRPCVGSTADSPRSCPGQRVSRRPSNRFSTGPGGPSPSLVRHSMIHLNAHAKPRNQPCQPDAAAYARKAREATKKATCMGQCQRAQRSKGILAMVRVPTVTPEVGMIMLVNPSPN